MPTTDYSFFHTRKYRLSLCLSIALFFYFFMIFFLPFGVDNYNPQHEYTLKFLLEIFYFTAVIFLFLLFNEFVLHPLLFQKTSVQAIIRWTLWTFLLLSTVIFFTYNFLGNWHDFRLSTIPTQTAGDGGLARRAYNIDRKPERSR